MPFFRARDKLVYYSHVPKCAGSAVAYYLQKRFGALGLYDNAFQKKRLKGTAWTRTSPQHVSAEDLGSVVPLCFFDAVFAVVRHPVSRTVSTYHFQREVEERIPATMSFGDWLADLEASGFTPFEYDNHVLPMTRMVPEGATIFHLEHSLDGLVSWLDRIAGDAEGPRVILPENARSDRIRGDAATVTPSDEDIARIARIYAEDFERFGYVPAETAPAAAPPHLGTGFIAARDRALRASRRPLGRLRTRLRRRLRGGPLG